MRNIFALSLAATFFFSGCSSKIEIEGEAFIEKNGVATKLANAEIQIVSEENFAKYINSKAAEIDSEISKINSQINSIEKSIADINKSTQAVMLAQLKMASMGGWNVNSLGGQYMQQQQNALSAQSSASISKSLEVIDDNKRDIEKLKKSIDGLKSGKNGAYYYSEKIPESILKVATNSDGKFKIEVPSEKRVALVASKGDNFWFIWITPNGPKNLNLTNANSLNTNCDVCIFNDNTTPQSFNPASKVHGKTSAAISEYRASHILVEREDQAKVLIEQIKGGARFDDLAKKHSKDTGSGQHGGDLGFAKPDSYVPEFGTAMAALKKGEMTSEPVRSAFGWHIIRVDDTR